MSLKSKWWCIKSECKHYNTHSTHKGALVVTEHCRHKDAVNSKKCDTPRLGRNIDTMQMCPVLYDMKED